MRHCFLHEVEIRVVFIMKYFVSYSLDWRGSPKYKPLGFGE